MFAHTDASVYCTGFPLNRYWFSNNNNHTCNYNNGKNVKFIICMWNEDKRSNYLIVVASSFQMIDVAIEKSPLPRCDLLLIVVASSFQLLDVATEESHLPRCDLLLGTESCRNISELYWDV